MSHQLRDFRRRIEALAASGGEFRLRCARTGERPVPATDLRFDDRSSAERAARLTRAYRDRLREWDPRAPYYDVTVHARPPGTHSPGDAAPASDPERTGAGSSSDCTDAVRRPPGDAT